MLCQCCWKIRAPHRSEAVKDGDKYVGHQCIIRHHKTFAALLKSADNGCEMCCQFRPFIEHAMLKRQGEIQYTESICSDSDGSGFTYEDPFQSESEYSSDSEPGTGSGYGTDYAHSDGGLETAPPKSASTSEHMSEASSANGNGTSASKKSHEILRWLLLGDAWSGSEQLWITGNCYEGTQKKNETRSCKGLSTGMLSAGSIEGSQICFDDNNFCLDGEYCDNRYALAIKAPGLWQWRHDPLKIRTDRKKPMRALRPSFELFQHRDHVEDVDPPVFGRNIVESPAHADAFRLVHNWLNQCRETHVSCPTGWEQVNELPTRVLDLGPVNEPLRLRLYSNMRTEIPRGTPYAILSHCWGSNPEAITKLTTTNLDAMRRGINMSSISKNFRDAIIITRGLKIRYLWVDALCIIQDSKEDWNQEASQMAKYYRNASITISALMSPGADHGILLPRSADKYAVKLSIDDGNVYARLILDDVASIMRSVARWSYSYNRPQLEDILLSKRGWTLQERVLSRRILHFSDQQMIWQCKSCLLSEDGEYYNDDTSKVKTTLVDFVNLDSITKSPTPYSLRWHHLVTEFSERSLTFDTDKLPALSGMAGEVAKVTGDEYCAGLWRRRLRDEMLWECRTPGSRCQNETPTWSWASINGAIDLDILKYRRVQREFDPIIRRVSVDLGTRDIFGHVRGGEVIISGMCHVYEGLKTFFSKRKTLDPGDDDADDDLEDSYEFQKLDVAESEYNWIQRPHVILCMGEYNYDWDPNEQKRRDLANKWGQQEFLILRTSSGRFSNVYERIGRASTQHRKRFPITEAKGWDRRTIIIV